MKRLLLKVFVLAITIFALLLVSALLLRFIYYGAKISENMVTNQLLLHKPLSMFCQKQFISVNIDKPDQTLINSPPYFDAYALTDGEYKELPKRIVVRNFFLNSVSGLQPDEIKYHNFFFQENTRIETSACYNYEGDDDNANTAYVYMYIIKSNKVFKSMKKRLYSYSCNDLSQDDCSVTKLILNKNCESGTNATRSIKYVNNTKTDNYIFAFVYENKRADKSAQSSGISLWLTYFIQSPMYDVTYLSYPLAKKVNKLYSDRRLILLDFPYLRTETNYELYNLELTIAYEPNSLIYLAVFGLGGIMLLLLMACFLHYLFSHQRGYEQLTNDAW